MYFCWWRNHSYAKEFEDFQTSRTCWYPVLNNRCEVQVLYGSCRIFELVRQTVVGITAIVPYRTSTFLKNQTVVTFQMVEPIVCTWISTSFQCSTLIHGELQILLLQWPNVGNRSDRDDLRGVDLGYRWISHLGPAKVKNWTYSSLRPVIMCLDVFEVCGISECIIIPIKLLHPSIHQVHININFLGWNKDALVDGWISVTNCAEIALEMTNVDRIEPNLTDRHQSQNDCPNAIAFKHTIVTQSLTSASVSLSPTR